MGLFEKLRTTLDYVENKLQSTNKGTALSSTSHPFKDKTAKNPLANEQIKKYFEILCGMGKTFRERGHSPMADLRTKRFVEYFLNDTCDEETLKIAKELLERSNQELHSCNETDRELRRHRKAIEESGVYCMDQREAYRRFCQEEIDAATVEYNYILEVIKDNVNYIHFSQGLHKMNCDYAMQIMVIFESFHNGNPITQELIKQYLIDSYTTRINDETNKKLHYVGDDIAMLIVKALHFEKYGYDRKNYKTASYEEYRNFVMVTDNYKRVIDNHPFEKELYTEKLAKRIAESCVFGSLHTSLGKERFFIADVEDYFCDAACHFLWTEIVRKGAWVNEDGESINETRDYNELFGILATYFVN